MTTLHMKGCFAIALGCVLGWVTHAADVELNLRSRSRETGQVLSNNRRIDPGRVGVVVMDMWSYHWCMTCSERAAALVPRMNRALEGARALGMTVIFTPTSGIASYEDSPQRRASIAIPDAPWPELVPVAYPACGFKNAHSCRCGPGIDCPRNWGGDSMNPELRIESADLMAWGTREVWNIVRSRGLEQLLYVGIAADICVLGKGEGMVPMRRLGVPCALARDLTDTDSYPPKEALEHTLKFLETEFAPTFHFGELLKGCGRWETSDAVEMVRLRPWGKPKRPYFFRDRLTLHLDAPEELSGEIHYTLDGTEPTELSPRYSAPLVVTNDVRLRVQSFRGNTRVGLPSDGYYVRIPATPPAPTVRLWELQPKSVKYSDSGSEWHVPARTWGMTMRGENYYQGITLHAPGEIEYSIPEGSERFVALAGADDVPKGRFNAQFLGQYPSMRFQVWVDGVRVAESPVMRLGQEPWPFDIPLAKGAKVLRLVVTDADDGARLDFGDFAKSGFVIPQYKGPRNLY
jgi:nicotinamidase-related amidase